MAYRFNGSSDWVEFAIAPLNAATFGVGTIACYFKRNTINTFDALAAVTNSSLSERLMLYLTNGNRLSTFRGSSGPLGQTLTSTTLWYLVAATFGAGGSTIPRFHVHDGTSWTHVDGDITFGGTDPTVAGTDRLVVGRVSSSALWLAGDVVCAGIKKATSTDGQIETLTRTNFQSWRDFGFNWLIGFDSSLEAAGILQDQASPGTGDEIAITGTTAVSDPPGWAWVVGPAPVANFTGTPLTGSASLSVTFTDSSTNTPTSWAWDFGDGSTSTSQNPSHSYATSGVFTVSLTATNAAGSDTKTRSAYVTVSEAIAYATGGGISIW